MLRAERSLVSKIASELLIERLIDWGVDTIFGLPGDGINGITEALRRHQDRIRFIVVNHEEAAAFMDKYDIVAIGCDNSAIEVLGRPSDGFLAGHVAFLVNRGIHLVEHLMLKEMADDQCYECLFVVAPLPVVGAAGSPVNPIAIG